MTYWGLNEQTYFADGQLRSFVADGEVEFDLSLGRFVARSKTKVVFYANGHLRSLIIGRDISLDTPWGKVICKAGERLEFLEDGSLDFDSLDLNATASPALRGA